MNTGIIREKAKDIIRIVYKNDDLEDSVKEIGIILWELYYKGKEEK